MRDMFTEGDSHENIVKWSIEIRHKGLALSISTLADFYGLEYLEFNVKNCKIYNKGKIKS